nr:Chain B, L-pep1 [artificial sequences]8GQP_D Chain D, L-pep1 [artificial sequences]
DEHELLETAARWFYEIAKRA